MCLLRIIYVPFRINYARFIAMKAWRALLDSNQWPTA